MMSVSTFFMPWRASMRRKTRARRWRPCEIVFHKRRPGFDFGLGSFSKAIAWHVDEERRACFGNEVVHFLCAAGVLDVRPGPAGEQER